jgi:predicted ATPase
VRSGLEVASSQPLVGRDRELEFLLDRWEEARRGRGHVVIVSAEAGMGKSRLIQGLHDELAGTPHLWLDMQCSPFTSGSAFQPLIDLETEGLSLDTAANPEHARDLVVRGTEGVEGLRCEDVVPYLLALLSLPPSEHYPMVETSADERRERTFGALLQLVLRLSDAQPIAFVAEDVHWSDPSTLEFLGRLIDQVATAQLMRVVTSRPEFRAPWSQAHVSELKLERLSKRATRQMIQNAAGGRLP